MKRLLGHSCSLVDPCSPGPCGLVDSCGLLDSCSLVDSFHPDDSKNMRDRPSHKGSGYGAVILGAIVGLLCLSGCAAFRPIEGVPARFVPDEVKAPTRSGKKTIDLSLLSQTLPSVYHLSN